MRKIYFNIIAVAALALSLAACQKPHYVLPTAEREGFTSISAFFTSGEYNNLELAKLYVTDEMVTVDNNTYYFDEDGYMVTSKLMKIGQQKYYFGANGKMYTNRNFKLANGKKYHADENGVVKLVRKPKKTKKDTTAAAETQP